VLLCRGRSWTVSYRGVGKWRRLQGAWRDFAHDDGLRLGDACVFELVMPVVTKFLGRWGRGTGSRYVIRYLREIFTLRVKNEPVNLD
jgi:hypothetical protein